jgi:hypothetical protein
MIVRIGRRETKMDQSKSKRVGSSVDSHVASFSPFFITDFPEEQPTEMTPEEIRMEAAKWVQRCARGAFAVTLLWIGWIVTSQILLSKGIMSPNWYMLNADDEKLTGW